MALLDFIGETHQPTFLRKGTGAEEYIKKLSELLSQASGSLAKKLEREIALMQYGLAGEKQICFELENCHIPMYILHDLYFEHNGLSAQIDFMVFTKKCVFVIECKNLFGNITIDHNGNFIREYQIKNQLVKEGIYSPVTQNERHMELLKAMQAASRSNSLSRMIASSSFRCFYKPVVVLANPKTILYDRYAKKEIKDQIIRADQLAAYIQKANAASRELPSTIKETRNWAEGWLRRANTEMPDYSDKYKKFLDELNEQKHVKSDSVPEKSASEKSETAPESLICPKCGSHLIKRTAQKGTRAGKSFYGCSSFPSCRYIINISDEN